jgi:hypothetical protein
MKIIKSPALHMLALGAVLFAATWLRGDAAGHTRPRIVIPQYQIDMTLETFVADNQRLPDTEDRQRILEALVDQEVLYQYALTVGLQENEAVQRRLVQIADFVEANPHGDATEAERAAKAMELGLHHGDLVVRRILIDSAQRLIRSVVLMQTPNEIALHEYLAAHPQEFQEPATSRITQVTINAFKWPDTAARARELLAKIEGESLELEAAVQLGDEPFVEPHLPALDEQALATKFGHDFAAAVLALPEGGWVGPIASRYGDHLVYVHERREAHLPPLEEIQSRLADRLLQERADQWLAERLVQLRQEFEIVLPEVPS